MKDKRQKKTTRTGIPILDRDTDLYRLFLKNENPKAEDGKAAIAPPAVDATASRPELSEKKPPDSNRHGLPILETEASLFELFGEAAPGVSHPDTPGEKSQSEQDPSFGRRFAGLVQRTFSGRRLEDILDEKGDLTRRKKPMSTGQKIKAYPAVQEQIDLHGCTVIQAESRTEAFIRASSRKGLMTLRIIVGKGLHSKGAAVLPDAVHDRLSALKAQGDVLAFEWERHKKQKSGAIIVYLEA
jgi:DNA-nicking Smr family endonuclease